MGINLSRGIILPNPPQASPQSDELIAAPAQRCFQSQRRPEASTVGPVGILRVTCQLRGIAVISRQALMCHKARNDAYGERASAESESEDAVVFFWRRATTAGAITSIALGTAVTILWNLIPWAKKTEVDAVYPALAASVISLIVVSFLTPPPTEAKLKPFFE